jgi:hypothetical protein
MSAFGGEAQIFCSLSALPVVTDAVEKVSAKKLWNSNLKRWNPANRFLNQDCAFVLGLESMLLRDPLKILFQQHRPAADMGWVENPAAK